MMGAIHAGGAVQALAGRFLGVDIVRFDDDFADRLSYFYTTIVLMMMAVLVSFKQFGGRPLECWVPAHFKESWEAYTEMYCWAQNTYWLPFDKQIPETTEERRQSEISYYQWVPFFLLMEAFLFYLPCMVWRLLNGISGIRIHDVISAFMERENIDPDVRARNVVAVAHHLENALRYQRARNPAATNIGRTSMSRTSRTKLAHIITQQNTQTNSHRLLRCLNLRYYESFITALYLVVKVIYACNAFGNLFLMNYFLQTDTYTVYGVGVLLDLMARKSWQASGSFPRVTLCDFTVRELGQTRQHTVQCVLVINIFIEKIFIFLWLWFSLLAAVTLLDLLYWFSVSSRHEDRVRFMMRHLHVQEVYSTFETPLPPSQQEVDEFVNEYVKVDGIFALRMVSLHAGSMVCTELANALWRRYLKTRPRSVSQSSSPSLQSASQSACSHHPMPNAVASPLLMQPTLGKTLVDETAVS